MTLLKTGINSSEISYILASRVFNKTNEYTSNKTRELPIPTKIEFDLSDRNIDRFLVNFNNSRIKNGYKLTPEEEFEHIGVHLNINNVDINKIEDKPFLDESTGKLKEQILFYYLISKSRTKSLTDEENKMLLELYNKRMEYEHKIVENEIIKSVKSKNQFSDYKNQLELLQEFLLGFRSKRYTSDKKPVWIDFERLVHILVRHVKETNFGEKFSNKTKFQYVIDDLHSLISIVLNIISKEIQNHFDKYPNRDFKRHGEMCVYYNGDYYVIHIESTGRLMNFYKRE